MGTLTAERLLPVVPVLERVDELRVAASQRVTADHKAGMGQFLTPMPVARFMASMVVCDTPEIRVLDPGAGVGSLFAAVVERLLELPNPPASISVTAYELDTELTDALHTTVRLCRKACAQQGVHFSARVITCDFIKAAGDLLENEGLFGKGAVPRFTCAILNPPYRKINAGSDTRRQIRRLGLEASNLYAGFVGAAIRLLGPSGQIVAVTPRSFSNGPYFRPFREFLLRETAISRVHVFESRSAAFSDEDVLQENVIFRAVRSDKPSPWVTITSSESPHAPLLSRRVRRGEFVRPDDPESFIHVAPEKGAERVAGQMGRLTHSLPDLRLSVSTGRVVDFRAREFLRQEPEAGTVPLIYPVHFEGGYVVWPGENRKKPNALVQCNKTMPLLIPNGNYVLTKRFSAKEERRRVVAVIYDDQRVRTDFVGFENHVNYFHRKGRGLDLMLARGLVAFLNSTPVDQFFRQFSGHTQVNATDLRNMRYPSLDALLRLGAAWASMPASQQELDALVERTVFSGSEGNQSPP